MSMIVANHDVTLWTDLGAELAARQPLVAGTTYYAEIGGQDTFWDSIQWKWDLAIVITAITIESSNLPVAAPTNASVPAFYEGLRVWDAALVGWHPETAIATVTAAGGGSAASSATQLVHIGGGGQKRQRAKIVVGATGGKLRGIPHHKS